jgi:hypothetical protein
MTEKLAPPFEYLLRVRAKIYYQGLSIAAPAWQGAKAPEYQAYSKLLQRRQAGCGGAYNVTLFLREPLGVEAETGHCNEWI